jgi:tetratricopeptide (TPR) repeat protein
MPSPTGGGIPFEGEIDKLSNSVLDAIDAGRFDEAERICERLRREYPETFDWHARYAKLREAQGRFEEAAEHYAEARDLVMRQADGPSPGLADMFEQRRNSALAKAATRR